MKGGNLKRLLTAILCAGLIIFSAGCASQAAAVTGELEAAVDALEPDVPDAPYEEPVRFEDAATKLPSDEGLWLSYRDYRSLERNVIALREYAARLLLIVEYYREER